MRNALVRNWKKISTGILALTLLGAGGFKVHQLMADDCCGPGSPCCHPGSACCPHGTTGRVAAR